MDNTVINGVNGDNAVADEGSVRFTGLTGSATISNCNISGGFEDNFKIVNTSGSLNRLTFSNTTIGANSTTDGNDGIGLESTGSGTIMNVTVQNSVFTSARGDLFQLNVIGNSTSDLVFTGNALSNNHPGLTAIQYNSERTTHGRTVSLGDGVKIGSFQASRMILHFNGNTLRNIGGDGFEVAAGESVAAASTDMDLVITNNTINDHTQNPAILFVGGFGIFRFGDANQLLCLKLTGNTVTSTPAGFFDVYLDGNFGAAGRQHDLRRQRRGSGDARADQDGQPGRDRGQCHCQRDEPLQRGGLPATRHLIAGYDGELRWV